MVFSFSNLKRWLLVAGAAAGMVLPAQAQTMRHGQAIFFSPSDNGGTASNAPSLLPRSPMLPELSKSIQPQPFNLSGPPQQQPLPPPQPLISPAQAAQLQQAADRQKNWALMTPEEILGIPTPEKIMGVPERGANGERNTETLTERYYTRQQRAENQATNSRSFYNSERGQLFSNRNDVAAAPGFFSGLNDTPKPTWNSFLNGTPDSRPADEKVETRGWSRAATQTPVQTPAQLAAAAEFQKMLDPRPAPAASRPVNAFSLSARPASDSSPSASTPSSIYLQPLDSVQMPTGVKPLQKLVDQKASSTTPVAPEWQPQAPPWMSTAPQPGAMPQRKF